MKPSRVRSRAFILTDAERRQGLKELRLGA
jgi:hypothetical protein